MLWEMWTGLVWPLIEGVESSCEHGNVISVSVSTWLMEQQLPVYLKKKNVTMKVAAK